MSEQADQGVKRLKQAVATFLSSIDDSSDPRVLWSMHWEQRFPTGATSSDEEHVVALRSLPADPAFDDEVLLDVKMAWQRITQPEDPDTFMKFEARDGTIDDADE